MNEQTQDTFILRVDFFPQIKMLNREQRGDLMTAIFAYSAGEKLPEMDQVTAMCFGFIRSSLDANAERYQARCAKNRENGGRGGRPTSKPGGAAKAHSVSEKTDRLSEKPNGFFENPIDIDIDTDSDLDSDSDSGNVSLSLRSREAPSSAGPTDEEREEFYRIFFLKNFRDPRAEVGRFVAHYQATGWKRKGEKIVDRAALAQAWTEQSTTSPPRFPAPFMASWGAIYRALKPVDDCGPMFDDLHAVQVTPERQIVLTTRTPGGALRDFIERHLDVVRPLFESSYPGHAIHYRVPRR